MQQNKIELETAAIAFVKIQALSYIGYRCIQVDQYRLLK